MPLWFAVVTGAFAQTVVPTAPATRPATAVTQDTVQLSPFQVSE